MERKEIIEDMVKVDAKERKMRIEKMVNVAEKDGKVGLEKLLSTLLPTEPAPSKSDIQKFLDTTCSDGGYNAFQIAVDRGLLNAARVLLEAGANINALNKPHETLLGVAALICTNNFDGFLDMFIFLVNHKDIDLKEESQGFKVFQYLACSSNISVVRMKCINALVQAGRQWITPENCGNVLLFAMSHHQIDMLNILIENLTNEELADNGNTMYQAIKAKFYEGVSALIRAKVSVDAPIIVEINNGYSRNKRKIHTFPLMFAVQVGHVEILQALIEGNANLEQRDAVRGKTALHEAVFCGFVEGVHILLNAGVKVTALNSNKQLPCVYTKIKLNSVFIGRDGYLTQTRSKTPSDKDMLIFLTHSNSVVSEYDEKSLAELGELETAPFEEFYQKLSTCLKKEHINYLAVKIKNIYLDQCKEPLFNPEKMHRIVVEEVKKFLPIFLKTFSELWKVKGGEKSGELMRSAEDFLIHFLMKCYFNPKFQFNSLRLYELDVQAQALRNAQIEMLDDWNKTGKEIAFPQPIVNLINDYIDFIPMEGFSTEQDCPYFKENRVQPEFLELRGKLVIWSRNEERERSKVSAQKTPHESKDNKHIQKL